MANTYECLGDYEKAYKCWKSINYDRWDRLGDAELLEDIFYNDGYFAFIQELARLYEEALVKGLEVSEWLAYYQYYKIGQYDKAIDFLDSIYSANPHDPELPYQSTSHVYERMKGNQRYLELLRKMNLPVE